MRVPIEVIGWSRDRWSLSQINLFRSRLQGLKELALASRSREKRRNMLHVIVILHAKPVDHRSFFLPRQADINKDDDRKQQGGTVWRDPSSSICGHHAGGVRSDRPLAQQRDSRNNENAAEQHFDRSADHAVAEQRRPQMSRHGV